MSWQIQFEGSKGAVTAAVVAMKGRDEEALATAKNRIVELIALLPSTQLGVRVLASGNEKDITRLEVEGRVLQL